MSPSETARAMARLADVYEKPVTKALLTSYHEALRDLDAAEVNAAVSEWIALSEWFPRPAQLRRQVAEASGSVPTEQAWKAVLGVVARFGRYREAEALDSLDPVTRAAVEQTGYQAICNSTLIAAERKVFLAAHAALTASGVRARQLPPASGRTPLAASSAVSRVAAALRSPGDE